MSYSSEVLADSPLVYWRFEDQPSNQMLDSSGNNRHGVYSGAATSVAGLVVGDSDKAMQFAGKRAQVPNGTWMDRSAFTVLATIKPGASGAYQGIAARWTSSSPYNPSSFLLRMDNDNKLALYIFSGNAFTVAKSTSTMAVGTTYDVAGTYDATTGAIRVYINGALEGSATQLSMNASDHPLSIGGSSWHTAEAYTGVIDDVAYIPSVLDATQLAALRAARLSSGYSTAVLAYSPLGYWRLNDASPTNAISTMADSSGASRNGTLAGSYAVVPSLLAGAPTERAISFPSGGEASIASASWMDVDYFTVECLVTFRGDWSSDGAWLVGRDVVGNASELDWRLGASSTGFSIVMQLATGGSYISIGSTGVTPTAGQTYHVAATFDGTNLRIYVNGVQRGTTATSGVTKRNATAIYVGSYGNTNGNDDLRGGIDEIAFYGTALSAARINAHHYERLSGLPVPGVPTSPTGVGSVLKTTLSWAAPAADPENVGSYEVRINGGSAIDTGGALSYIFTGLAASTTYTMEVRSKNPTGTSAWVSASATTLAITETYDGGVMTDAPIAYWRFNDLSGNALDSSGNARHLPWLGSEFTRNVSGLLLGETDTCVDFLGTGYLNSGYASLAYDASWMNTIRGFDCLIKPDGTAGVIFARDDETNRSFLFGISAQKIYVTWWNEPTGGPTTLTGATTLGLGYTAHVGATLSGGVWRIYVNGAVDATSAGGQSVKVTTAPITVGAPGYWHGNPKFDGKIDELAVYATPPSTARLNAHFVSAGSPMTLTEGRISGMLTEVAVRMEPDAKFSGMATEVAVRLEPDAWISDLLVQVATKVPEPPGVPTNVAVVPTDTTLTLSWDPPVTGDPPVSYEVRLNGGTPIAGAVSPHLFINRPPSTLHDLEVRAIGVTGLTSDWVLVVARTSDAPQPPGVPIEFRVTRAYPNALRVDWAAPVTGGPVDHYEVCINRGSGETTPSAPGPWQVVNPDSMLEVLPTGWSPQAQRSGTGWVAITDPDAVPDSDTIVMALPQPVLTPTSHYELEVSWTFGPDPTYRHVQISTTTTATNSNAANDAYWWELYEGEVSGSGAAEVTVTYPIGPGLDQYDDAMSDVPPGAFVLVEAPLKGGFRQIRWRTVPAPAEGTAVRVYPTAMDFGTASVLSFVGGGAEVLSDGSDATYLKCTNLDSVAFQGVTVTFPSFMLDADDQVDFRLEARYEQVSGSTEGQPGVVLDAFALNFGSTQMAGALRDEEGYWAIGGDYDPPAPNALDSWVYAPGTTTDMVGEFGFNHTGFGVCDFRVYELSIYAEVSSPSTAITGCFEEPLDTPRHLFMDLSLGTYYDLEVRAVGPYGVSAWVRINEATLPGDTPVGGPVDPIIGGGPDPIFGARVHPVKYLYAMANARTGELIAALPLTAVNYSIGMFSGQELSGSVYLPDMFLEQMAHPPLNIHEHWPHPDRGIPLGSMFEVGNVAIYVIRNGEVIWGGMLWSRAYSSGNKTMAITALSWDAYVYYRALRKSVVFLNPTDKYTIWRALLNQVLHPSQGDFGWQGDAGLNSGNVSAEGGAVVPWTGIYDGTGLGNQPVTDYVERWPNSAPPIEVPPAGLVSGLDPVTIDESWRGYDMDTVGTQLEQFANTNNLLNTQGFDYRVLCWWDGNQARFRQRYTFGEMTYVEGEDADDYTGVPVSIRQPLFGQAHEDAENTIFDFPGHIRDWSLAESMENAATRLIVTGAGEQASKIAAYASDAESLGGTDGFGAGGWLLFDKVFNYDTSRYTDIQDRANKLLSLHHVPSAAQIDDIDNANSSTTQRASQRSTDLSVTLYVDPATQFPPWKLGDWVTFAIDDPLYGGVMYLQRRIIRYSVTVLPDHESDYSHEQITLELTDDTKTEAGG